MLEEREAWMERRASFTTLYVDTRGQAQPGYIAAGVMVAPPRYPLSGVGFNLIVAPISVQRDHKQWLEDTLLTRLAPGGKLILVDDL